MSELDIDKAIEHVMDALDKAVKHLSKADYISVMEGVVCDIETRLEVDRPKP